MEQMEQMPGSKNETKDSGAERNHHEIKRLYRGIWADRLENEQLLPVGGSMFRKDMHLNLMLDFDHFDEQLKNANPERLKEVYESGAKDSMVGYLENLRSDIDPFLFFACLQAQLKVDSILKTKEEANGFERAKKYDEDHPSKISELIGNTMCAERAALGQYIMQKFGITSSYMSGINMADYEDMEEFPENHSFLVIGKDGKKYVFDIARIHSAGVPRILSVNEKMSSEIFNGMDNLLVRGEDVLDHSAICFGVGSTACNLKRNVLE